MVRFSQRCFVVSVSTAVCEIVVLTTIVIYLRTLRMERVKRQEPKEKQECILYDKYVNAGQEDKSCPRGLKKEIRRNVSVCCGQISDVLDKIVPKGIQKSYDSDMNPELLDLNISQFKCEIDYEERPMVKLHGLDRNRKHGNKIFWTTTKTSDTMSGLKYLKNNGTVFVNQSRFYFILLQVVSKLDNENKTGFDMEKILKHSVHLVSYNGRRKTLLENANQKCKVATKMSTCTSITGAVFRLEKGDQLYVATSHSNSLVHDGNNNFFSIHSV